MLCVSHTHSRILQAQSDWGKKAIMLFGVYAGIIFIMSTLKEFGWACFPFTLGLGWRTSQLQEAQGEGLAVGQKTFWGRLVGSHPDSDVFFLFVKRTAKKKLQW